MPFIYSIDPEYDLLWNRLLVEVRVEEIRDLAEKFRYDPGFHMELSVLTDLRTLERDAVVYLGLCAIAAEMADYCRIYSRPIKYAFISFTQLGHGMARMFQTFLSVSDQIDVGLLEYLDAAAGFPGLPDNPREMLPVPLSPDAVPLACDSHPRSTAM